MATPEDPSGSRKGLQESGFSIAEVLVATAVMLTVLMAVYMVYDTAQQNQSRGLAKAAVQQDVRATFERMARELRGAAYAPSTAGCTPSPPPPNGITAISSSPVSVTFLTDVDRDSCTDQVIYTFVPPTNATKPCDDSDPQTIGKITRSVQRWTGTAWDPATPTASDAARCITALAISYYDASGTPTTIPANVARLYISMTGVENSRMTGAQTYTLKTDVRPRNL